MNERVRVQFEVVTDLGWIQLHSALQMGKDHSVVINV